MRVKCHHRPSRGDGRAPGELENFQLWFLAQPAVLGKNCRHKSWNSPALVPLEHSWLGGCKAVTSALNCGGTNCSKIQGDAVTKSVLLPFLAAQGASIKFYSIVNYFLYVLFFLLDKKSIVFSLDTDM